MSETIDKQKLVDYLNGKISESLYGKEAFAYQSVLMAITQSDLFDIPNNHIREALENVRKEIGYWKDPTAALNVIGAIVDEALNTSVTCCENPDNQTFGPNEVIKTSTTACMNCGKLSAEPSIERVILRPEVQWFAEQMELTLQKNDHKGGWQDCTLQYLFEKLDEEVGELSATLSDKETISEASDVANIVMMIADNARLSGLSAEKGAEG